VRIPARRGRFWTRSVRDREAHASSARIRKGTRKPDDELNRILSDLQLAEFIYEQPAVGDIEYTFKHALTHEVAYGSLLFERRRTLHERVGDALESLYANGLDDHLGELAHHYGHSGNTQKTVEYVLAAAEQALRRGAHAASIAYLCSAIQSLSVSPQGRQRDRLELILLLALWEPLAAVEGFAGATVEQTLSRAKELCLAVGNSTDLSHVCQCRSLLHLLR